MMIMAISLKALLIRINLFFLALFLVVYAVLFVWPSSISVYNDYNPATFVRCSLSECHPKMENGIKMKAVLEEPASNHSIPERVMAKREKPSFLKEVRGGMRIGMVNMEGEDMSEWNMLGKTIRIDFEQVSEYFEWKALFPEWIDEEEEIDGPSCPEIPIPDFNSYGSMDMIVAKLPVKHGEEGWGRDVFRLQVHLIVANLAVKKGKGIWSRGMKVLFLSKHRPMPDLFRCDDLLRQEGDWWYYEPDLTRLEQKVSLPVGSCNLALPLWGRGIHDVYDVSKIERSTKSVKREAYATVLHSSEAYVCGAITLAQSLLRTGTQRDLILLLDNKISAPTRKALVRAGWKLRFIKRIRNPKAEKNTYNEYNYSKFRLWQLTEYDKIIFIDADIIVLRNLDILFHFPQISARGNDGSIFNSGIMVIEPSNCTFRMFMQRMKDIVSYNGGDQGFLNEVFVWWHRLPRRINYMKIFWSNSTVERAVKNQLFGSDPPKLYSIHYLGLKPWLCYRDYDCNWDLEDQHIYASDVAHRRWWKLHDSMDKSLQKFCGLKKQRKIELEWDRNKARAKGLKNGHWKIKVTDPRKFSTT